MHSCIPVRPLFTTKSTNNVHMTIRTGPQINGRKWPDLVDHVFLNITCIAMCTCLVYKGNTRHQEAQWEEGKPAELVRWRKAAWTNNSFLDIFLIWNSSVKRMDFPEAFGLPKCCLAKFNLCSFLRVEASTLATVP